MFFGQKSGEQKSAFSSGLSMLSLGSGVSLLPGIFNPSDDAPEATSPLALGLEAREAFSSEWTERLEKTQEEGRAAYEAAKQEEREYRAEVLSLLREIAKNTKPVNLASMMMRATELERTTAPQPEEQNND